MHLCSIVGTCIWHACQAQGLKEEGQGNIPHHCVMLTLLYYTIIIIVDVIASRLSVLKKPSLANDFSGNIL